jgi:hypothetical protein
MLNCRAGEILWTVDLAVIFSHRHLIDIAGVCAKIGRFVTVLARYILLNLTETGVKCTVTHPNPSFSIFDTYNILYLLPPW